MSAFVRAVWRKPVWGWFSGRAVRWGRDERGAIVFCVMYNSPSSLGSRVGSSGPPSVPVISVAVARGTIYPTPHCHDILETLLSLPRFSFPALRTAVLIRERDLSLSRFVSSRCRDVLILSLASRCATVLGNRTHLSLFQSHPFFTFFSFGQFCVSESPLLGRGKGKKGHISEQSNNVT